MVTDKTLFQPVQNECRFLKSDISGRFFRIFFFVFFSSSWHIVKMCWSKGCYEVLTVSRSVFYFLSYVLRYTLCAVRTCFSLRDVELTYMSVRMWKKNGLKGLCNRFSIQVSLQLARQWYFYRTRRVKYGQVFNNNKKSCVFSFLTHDLMRP